jgi:predicted ATP-dependent endonuclease of OLD family
MPIIGVNECGKTTILHALFAFDFYNDKFNDGRHLKDVSNLYKTKPEIPIVSAQIEIDFDEFLKILKKISRSRNLGVGLEKPINSYKRLRNLFPSFITITRDIISGSYKIEENNFSKKKLNEVICEKILMELPYILYFDDFRDTMDDKIEIIGDEEEATGWLAIINTLFEKTDNEYSVFNLTEMEERQRKGVLAKVNRKLNSTLTKEWQNFRLDDIDALKIEIEFTIQGDESDEKRYYIKFDVIEVDSNGDEHFFFVKDRSKGFFWFFNFVMKLEFNPKVIGSSDVNAIYLLDEPGSYLHSSAQSKLNSIRIADKDGRGNITLDSIHSHKGEITERRSAYQPLFDALQIKPLKFEFVNDSVIIVEGIVDFFLLEMFKGNRSLTILSSVGANSIKYYISLMIAWRMQYCALWDNDSAGRSARDDATRHFGLEEAKNRFILLPMSGKRTKRIFQNLIMSSDLVMIREILNIPRNTSFDKTISSMFYSDEKTGILQKISAQTRSNFTELFDLLPI